MKKLGMTYPAVTAEQLATIQALVADRYTLIQCKVKDPQLQDCEIVFGQLSRDNIERATQLKWLHTSSAGVEAYTNTLSEEVVITNSSGAYGIGIAEHLLGMTLSLLKNAPAYYQQQMQQQWHDLGQVKSIYGSTVLVVGMGDLGCEYAKRVHALGATVVGVTRTVKNLSDYPFAEQMVTLDKLPQVVTQADIVVLCLPGTPQTAGLFDDAMIGQMKPGALLLNAGRGSAIDQVALANALNSGHLGGAGLDVTTPEPLPAEDPLWRASNLLITPHVSGNMSLELTTQLVVSIFIQNLKRYLAGQPFERVVDRVAGY